MIALLSEMNIKVNALMCSTFLLTYACNHEKAFKDIKAQILLQPQPNFSSPCKEGLDFSPSHSLAYLTINWQHWWSYFIFVLHI